MLVLESQQLQPFPRLPFSTPPLPVPPSLTPSSPFVFSHLQVTRQLAVDGEDHELRHLLTTTGGVTEGVRASEWQRVDESDGVCERACQGAGRASQKATSLPLPHSPSHVVEALTQGEARGLNLLLT